MGTSLRLVTAGGQARDLRLRDYITLSVGRDYFLCLGGLTRANWRELDFCFDAQSQPGRNPTWQLIKTQLQLFSILDATLVLILTIRDALVDTLAASDWRTDEKWRRSDFCLIWSKQTTGNGTAHHVANITTRHGGTRLCINYCIAFTWTRGRRRMTNGV